ncbi:MAG: beta-ketoacyl synthase N-terminal-like domain-containing protein [Thermodesulfobacteriota bacterium]
MKDAVVVTGIGVVSPLGTGEGAAWRALTSGDVGIRALSDDDERLQRGVDPNPLPQIGRAGWVRGFHPREHVRSPHLRRMDWCSRMLVAAVRQAFAAAGLEPLDEPARRRTALVVGSALGNQRETATYLDRVLGTGLGAAQPMVFPNLVLNASAGYAAIELGIEGPNLCVAEHEASGEAAVAAAHDLLASGACDVACAAGVDEISAFLVDELERRRLLHPESMSLAQQRRARGSRRGLRGRLIPGEGAAALVLERASHAHARAARARAVLSAARIGSVPASAYGFPRDADTAAVRLLEIAGGESGAISGVVGGASGVPARDRIEGAVLRLLVQRGGAGVGYCDFKHLAGEWGAAGCLGAALAVLALEHGVLPGGPGPDGEEVAEVRAPRRLLVPGVARGGALAPLVLDAAARTARG